MHIKRNFEIYSEKGSMYRVKWVRALTGWKSPTISASWLVLLGGGEGREPGLSPVGKPQEELSHRHPLQIVVKCLPRHIAPLLIGISDYRAK